METRTAAIVASLMLLAAAPTAAAGPDLFDACLRGPLATCLDSASPRVRGSELLPGILVADPARATAEEQPAESAAPAAPPSGARADAAQPPPAVSWERALAVALALLSLVLFVALLASRRARRTPRSAKLADAARARAMQEDLDKAWREARARA
ncbi:MAG TPA: hypothetical protein VFH78_14675 [Candidatus Thermoplasmatota archaeon]|nr:hypothetical protein [Candidatus Thermoplasmatota archaeon]